MSGSAGPPPARRPRAVSGGVLYKLVQCRRRLWLDVHHPAEAAAPDDHDALLRRRGLELEASVAATLPDLAGPFVREDVAFDQAVRETREALTDAKRPLYQAALRSADGLRTGTPDFLIPTPDGWVVRDAKLSLHPERREDVRLQLEHYASLLESSTGERVTRVELVNGRGETRALPRMDAGRYDDAVALARETLDASAEPDLLLGHSACEDCPYYAHCWDRAEAEQRIEVLPEVWRARAETLHAMGVYTIDQLAACEPARLRDPSLAKAAPRIVAEARAHASGAPVWLAPPRLPQDHTPVWLDLEGDARGEDADVPIYLWGLAVEQAEPRFEPLFADFEPGGDARGWNRFVARALEIHASVTRPVWVHWHHYELVWIRRYLRRHGAPPEFERAVLAPGATFDLHRAVDRSVRLPLRSYSIKKVAAWLGFRWRNPDSGSEWSVAELARARASADPAERARILAGIAQYNEDDLLAMRAVWHWMMREGPRAERA